MVSLLTATGSPYLNSGAGASLLTSSFQDGHEGAVPGAAQYPTLLNGYPFRPPWQVAGVDYRIGPHGTPSLDPRTSPAGTNYNSTAKQLLIIADDVTLDGYDFTLSGGISIYCPSNNRLTIRNFLMGGSNYSGLPTAVIDFRGNGLTIEYGTIDGTSTVSSTQSSLISVNGSGAGAVLVRYVWGKNYPQHWVEYSCGGDFTTEYNLMDEYIQASPGGVPSHMNWKQFGAGHVTRDLFRFNTGKQTTVPGAEGGQNYFNVSGTIDAPQVLNNTVLVPVGGQMSNIFHGTALGTGPTTVTGVPVASDNYFDLAGLGAGGPSTHPGAFYGGSFPAPWTGNGGIDMNTGAVIPL